MLEKLLQFTKLLNDLRLVERVVRVNGSDRWENDVEHSFHLAMLAWYILDAHQHDLDREKVLRYALAHDLIEVYAGDTYIYSEDQKLLDSKPERERLAAERLQQELPEVPDMHESIRAYIAKDDRESRFVYALDKIEPLLKMYLDNGRTWREKQVTLAMLYENKKSKVAISPEIQPYFDELMNLLKSREKELFS